MCIVRTLMAIIFHPATVQTHVISAGVSSTRSIDVAQGVPQTSKSGSYESYS